MCFRPPTVVNGPVKCPKCGAEVDPKADACPSCGAKATPMPGIPTPPGAPTPPPVPGVPGAPKVPSVPKPSAPTA